MLQLHIKHVCEWLSCICCVPPSAVDVGSSDEWPDFIEKRKLHGQSLVVSVMIWLFQHWLSLIHLLAVNDVKNTYRLCIY